MGLTPTHTGSIKGLQISVCNPFLRSSLSTMDWTSLTIAESTLPLTDRRRFALLQSGRDQTITERSEAGTISSCQRPLQWGRDQVIQFMPMTGRAQTV